MKKRRQERLSDSPKVTMLAYGGISEARKSKMVENFGDSSENHTENSLSIFSHKPKLFGNECSIRCKAIRQYYHPVFKCLFTRLIVPRDPKVNLRNLDTNMNCFLPTCLLFSSYRYAWFGQFNKMSYVIQSTSNSLC